MKIETIYNVEISEKKRGFFFLLLDSIILYHTRFPQCKKKLKKLKMPFKDYIRKKEKYDILNTEKCARKPKHIVDIFWEENNC